ncbi:MAG: NAD(P)-dependent oxidoreductase [Candidatus Omnitrophica bacterium]|nr:NAD(P)-dependent oxidoreductase [Candidatus Omnitrophota bacterium]
MKVLVTGNQGYIGSVLVDMLLDRKYEVVGYDIGYYADCLLHPYNPAIRQIRKDIRDITTEDMEGVDAVIHLAALSNDPLGEFAPGLTEEINLGGTVKAALAAKSAGVKRFIYSSSQSMYGVSAVDCELDEDNSKKHPLTAYARTKWEAECALKKLADKNFHVVSFRPSTVFGASPRLRCDIVYNNLVGCAYATGRIEIKSDGSPWRPVVHVRDVSSAYIAGLEAPLSLVSGQAFNVGIPGGNFTVRELAEAAQRSVSGSSLVFTGEHGNDSRTYQVSFKKILSVLKDYFRPEWDLDSGGKELIGFFRKTGFNEDHFRGRTCARLKQIRYLQDNKKVSGDLRLFR